MLRMHGKAALVTGAARGLGYAIAERLGTEGARLLLVDRDADALDAAAERLGHPAFVADVADRQAVFAAAAFAEQAVGPVDVLVNNAGIFRPQLLLDVDESTFDQVLAVNLKSALFAMQAVLPQMRARGGGSIVNVASVAAVLAAPTAATYCASKAALAQLTAVAAVEFAGWNVRVNAVGPGTFDTNMARGAYDDRTVLTRVLARTPLGRLGGPGELAATVAYLASEDASYVTGQMLLVDGGRSVLNLTMPDPPAGVTGTS